MAVQNGVQQAPTLSLARKRQILLGVESTPSLPKHREQRVPFGDCGCKLLIPAGRYSDDELKALREWAIGVDHKCGSDAYHAPGQTWGYNRHTSKMDTLQGINASERQARSRPPERPTPKRPPTAHERLAMVKDKISMLPEEVADRVREMDAMQRAKDIRAERDALQAEIDAAERLRHDLERRGKQYGGRIRAGEQLSSFAAPPDWAVRGICRHNGVTRLVGEGDSGKTAVAVGMSMAYAAGIAWNGHETRSCGMETLYIAGEQVEDVAAFAEAYRLANGLDPVPGWHLYPEPVEIGGEGWPDFVQWLKYESYGLIVLDTQDKNTGDLNPDATADAKRILGGLDLLWRETEAAVVLTHHTGLGDVERGRGSKIIKEGIRAEIIVSQANGVVKLCTKRQKGTPLPGPTEYRFEPFEWMTTIMEWDEDAEDEVEREVVMSSVVLVEKDRPQGAIRAALPDVAPTSAEPGISLPVRILRLCVEGGSDHGLPETELREALGVPTRRATEAINRLKQGGNLISHPDRSDRLCATHNGHQVAGVRCQRSGCSHA